MTILIERIYEQVNALAPLSQDAFSIQFCGSQNPSYLRSMKCRKLEGSTAVFMHLMEALHQHANQLRVGMPHPSLQRIADRYDALGMLVGEEIAKRALRQEGTSIWVRDTLVRIIKAMNEDKSSKAYNVPPIIIC